MGEKVGVHMQYLLQLNLFPNIQQYLLHVLFAISESQFWALTVTVANYQARQLIEQSPWHEITTMIIIIMF